MVKRHTRKLNKKSAKNKISRIKNSANHELLLHRPNLPKISKKASHSKKISAKYRQKRTSRRKNIKLFGGAYGEYKDYEIFTDVNKDEYLILNKNNIYIELFDHEDIHYIKTKCLIKDYYHEIEDTDKNREYLTNPDNYLYIINYSNLFLHINDLFNRNKIIIKGYDNSIINLNTIIIKNDNEINKTIDNYESVKNIFYKILMLNIDNNNINNYFSCYDSILRNNIDNLIECVNNDVNDVIIHTHCYVGIFYKNLIFCYHNLYLKISYAYYMIFNFDYNTKYNSKADEIQTNCKLYYNKYCDKYLNEYSSLIVKLIKKLCFVLYFNYSNMLLFLNNIEEFDIKMYKIDDNFINKIDNTFQDDYVNNIIELNNKINENVTFNEIQKKTFIQLYYNILKINNIITDIENDKINGLKTIIDKYIVDENDVEHYDITPILKNEYIDIISTYISNKINKLTKYNNEFKTEVLQNYKKIKNLLKIVNSKLVFIKNNNVVNNISVKLNLLDIYIYS